MSTLEYDSEQIGQDDEESGEGHHKMLTQHHLGVDQLLQQSGHESDDHHHPSSIVWHGNVGSVLQHHQGATIATLSEESEETLSNILRSHESPHLVDVLVQSRLLSLVSGSTGDTM